MHDGIVRTAIKEPQVRQRGDLRLWLPRCVDPVHVWRLRDNIFNQLYVFVYHLPRGYSTTHVAEQPSTLTVFLQFAGGDSFYAHLSTTRPRSRAENGALYTRDRLSGRVE